MGCPPSLLDFGPFGLGKTVDLARLAVVLSRAHKVLGVVASRRVPILAQLLEGLHVHSLGLIRLRSNGKVGVTKTIRPLVVLLEDRWKRGGKLGAVGAKAER